MSFSGSQVISETFKTVRDRFGPMLGIWATFFGIQMALVVLLGFGMAGTAAAGLASENPLAMGAGMIVWFILFYVMVILVGFAQNGALLAISSPLKKLTFGEAFNAGIRCALPMLGVLVLIVFGYLAFALVAGIFTAVLGKVGLGLLVILLIPVLVFVGARLFLVFPVLAIEKVVNPITAIKRSWELTHGNVIKIILVSLVLVVASAILFALLILPFLGTIFAAEAGAAPSIGAGLGLLVGWLLLIVVLSLVWAAFPSVMHAELAGSTGEDFGATFG